MQQGNNRPQDNNRPNANVQQGNNRPQDNNRPNANVQPGNNHPNVNRPKPEPHGRPMPHIAPPRNWHPNHNVPVIRGILGLTFGSLYNATLDILRDQNYVIRHHANGIVYLSNVMQYNHNWDDVRLNYTSNRLTSAQFIYSTRRNSTSRYNDVYLTLSRTFGSPVSMRSIGYGEYECVWYGGDRHGMVTLEYYRHNGRYYTTLSFGTYY